MRAAARLALVVSVILGAGVTGCGSSGGTAAGACASPQLRALTAAGRDSVPVVLVHGMAGSPAIWSEGSPSMVSALRAVKGVTLWAFDYHEESLDWVTDPHIGPALAQSITCLATRSGRRVIVVAHSMGGLAAQFAIAQPAADGRVADDVAAVIAIATPFRGSMLLSIAQGALAGGQGQLAKGSPVLAALTASLLASCAHTSVRNLANGLSTTCPLVDVAATPLGADLQYGSAAVAALPQFPATLPVLTAAGDLDVGQASIGDPMVSVDSAISAESAGDAPLVVTCKADVAPARFSRSACYHSNLPANRTVQAWAVARVRDVLAQPRP